MIPGYSRKEIPCELPGIFTLVMSISISHIKDHSISVDQARYSTSVLAKYLNISTVKKSEKFYNTTFPSDAIFTNVDAYTGDEQAEKLTR